MTRLALDKSVITAVALAIVLIGGIRAYTGLPRNEDPGFTIRTALVLTYFPGASSERVENLVTDKIEEVVQEIPELDYVQSQSRTGISIVMVNIRESYKEMRPIWDNLRRKVDRIRPDLPEGIIGPTVDDEFGDVFGILMSVVGEGYSYRELKDIADGVRDELLLIPDAAKVGIYGTQDERVFIEFNDARLAELNLSVSQFQQMLQNRNIIIPGGDIRIDRERIVLEPSGNFGSVEEIGNAVVKLPGRSEVVYLRDICHVKRGYVDPPSMMVRSSGTPALAIGVSLREGGNVIRLGEDVASKVALLESRYPIGVEFETLASLPTRVELKIKSFASNLLQAIAIVLLVMLVSLGIRTGLLVASLIPMAILATLLVMRIVGIGLDQMSLAALIIALGMLIDNAIVMAESIMVHMRAGKRAYDAAIESSKELRVPLLTSSLTTAAAFLPIYLAKSSAGEYTGVIFIVVAITLLCSWVLALTMTPLLCVHFMRIKPGETEEIYDSRFYYRYRGFLITLLRHPWRTLSVAVLIFALAIFGMRFVPNIFFPSDNRPFFTAKLQLPTGTDILTTHRMVERIEEYIAGELRVGPGREEGIINWVSFTGGGEPRYILTALPEQATPSYAFMLLNATSYDAVHHSIDRLEAYCEEAFPDVVATIQPTEMGPPVQKPIQVRISGRDAAGIFAIADRVKTRLREIPGTRNIDDDWGRRVKKLFVEVDESRAQRAGVDSRDIAISLQSHLTGIAVTEFREESDLIPVTLRSEASVRENAGMIESINVYSQTSGQPVPLKQVADVIVEWEASKVIRRNRLKTVTVECDLDPGVTATVVNSPLIPWLEEEKNNWALGFRYELGGEIETSVKASKSIGDQVPIGALIILLLLVSQFNSLRKPLIILSTIPMALIGVTFGLIVFRSVFGFMTLLGVVSLAGIVINNAIVLLDRIRIEMTENGLPAQRAIIEAAQRRLRPIVLTTLTTVGGLIPLYLGGGPMWEPLAVAIMAGLTFSTILTLGLVPVLYSILYRVSFKGFRWQ